MSILLDAGPSLNFLAVGQQNILIQVATAYGMTLATPARVDAEMTRKAQHDRFARTGVAGRWGTLKSSGRITVLDDTIDDSRFIGCIERCSGMPAPERTKRLESLGELMVIAHASVLCQDGKTVAVLIDDRDGRRIARAEMRWLEAHGHQRFELWGTGQVVRQAADHPGWISGGRHWTKVYDHMRDYDDGLAPRP